MKKTRILASLLCLMMIVCALPMMQASAVETDTANVIAEALGTTDYQLAGYEQLISGYSNGETGVKNGTYTDDGLQLGASGSWGWTPANNAFTGENVTIVDMQLASIASSSDKVLIYIQDPENAAYAVQVNINNGYIYGIGYDETVKPDKPNNATVVAAKDGATLRMDTNPFQIMIVNKTDGVDAYVKSATKTDGEWIKVWSLQDHRHTDVNPPLSISSTVAAETTTYHYIKSVSVYKPVTAYATIESVLGVEKTASANAWDFANSTMDTHTRSSYTSITMPEGAKYTAEGLDLSKTNGTDTWKFTAFNAWSPTRNANGSATMVHRAVYAKAKGAVNFLMEAPNPYYDIALSVTPGNPIKDTRSGAVNHVLITPDNNWMEYLFVPTHDMGVGTEVWVKSATLTNDKWLKALNTTTSYEKDDDRTEGIQFSGTGVVAGWKTINYTDVNVTTDADARPANATYLYFDEEFDAAPSYPNIGKNSPVTFPGTGVASMPAGAITLQNVVIPVGGYAEFKVKNNGTQKFEFYDGAYSATTTMYKDYGSAVGTVPPGGTYLCDSDTVWRTWRVVRTADGYSTYSKIDGETGWMINGVNGYDLGADLDGDGKVSTAEEKATVRSTELTQCSISFASNATTGSVGAGALDYLKIYGPAPTNALTLADGYATLALEEGATLAYPKSLRAIVGEETGKLLVVTYKGSDMLKAQIVNVEDMANKSAILDARATDADTVKVFLWDSFSGLNRKTPVVTLNL